MLPSQHIIRILLFIKPSEREAWERDRLRQRKGLFREKEERKRFTGRFPRYPLNETDLFPYDSFRFVDREKNTIGDIYVFFNLHNHGFGKTLFIAPNEHSEGIDFAYDKNTLVDGMIHSKAVLRWTPLPLPEKFVRKKNVRSETCIVFHHPGELCENFETPAGHRIMVNEIGNPPTLQSLLPSNNLLLTGGTVAWCERYFSTTKETLGLESFFQFFHDHHPMPYSDVTR